MKSLQRIKRRHGRCYELAARAITEEPGAEQFTLVHGTAALLIGEARGRALDR
jgi:hypothetical protein